jgi:GNAT superfamily N-acetyltransferase
MSYKLKTVSFIYPRRIIKTADILYRYGKDMAKKSDLHHWDNSKFKTLIIVLYGLLRNKTFLVSENKAVATFSIRKDGNALHFGKLATLPECSGRGVGSWCMQQIEEMARKQGCTTVTLEVYDQSNNAREFYLHRGYVVCGEVKTLKYSELKLKKDLN